MSQPILQLLLIENDPIFSLGLHAACEKIPDLLIAAEASNFTIAWQILAAHASGSPKIDLVILDIDVLAASELTPFCQQFNTQYPHLSLLLLSHFSPSSPMGAASPGRIYYCRKGIPIAELMTTIRQAALGEIKASEIKASEIKAEEDRELELGNNRRDTAIADPQILAPYRQFWHQLLQSGLQQIEVSLAEVKTELQNPQFLKTEDFAAMLDRAITQGHCRELLAARWLVSHLLLSPLVDSHKPAAEPLENSNIRINSQPLRSIQHETPSRPRSNLSRESKIVSKFPLSNATVGSKIVTPFAPSNWQDALFNGTIAKLQSELVNFTGMPLEIDILQWEKKRQLLLLILQKLTIILEDLRFSQVQPEQLPFKRDMILRDLWQATTTDFFGKYYTVAAGLNSQMQWVTQATDATGVEIVPILLTHLDSVQQESLNKIPLVIEFFGHLLFQTPLIIDNIAYNMGSPEAMQRAEVLLQNLVIQIGNSVIQPLLNNFADVEEIKQTFYDRQLISTREIEKFRNNLSWRYRIEKYLGNSIAIFESRFELLVFNERGLQKISIYAPRKAELEQLSGIQFVVTIALEIRDALAPRVRATIAFIGTGIVYILTQVIGRGIGLIGRGVLQGIGNSWQNNK